MMKSHLLTSLALSITVSLSRVQAQGIRAAGDNMPVVKKTAAAITPNNYTGRQIAVGSGGGVTGFSTAYYLFENGKLFAKRSRDTTFTFIGQQTAKNTKGVFATVEDKCKIKTTKFDNPGNLYKFVRWRKGKVAHIVTWGEAGKTVPANYPKFYNSFMAMIPASLRLN
ncbi:FAD-binding oxidoreductase [Spirosoma areae]